MTLREAITTFAKSQEGITELPHGSNIVKFNNWYYPDGSAYHNQRLKSNRAPAYAWCGTFMAYIYHFGGQNHGWMLPSRLHEIIGYVPSADNWLKKHVGVVEDGKAQPGDIIIFDWNLDEFEDHIGMVLEEHKNHFITIEGNTASDDKGDQSNGGGVFIKKRKKSAVTDVYNIIDWSE